MSARQVYIFINTDAFKFIKSDKQIIVLYWYWLKCAIIHKYQHFLYPLLNNLPLSTAPYSFKWNKHHYDCLCSSPCKQEWTWNMNTILCRIDWSWFVGHKKFLTTRDAKWEIPFPKMKGFQDWQLSISGIFFIKIPGYLKSIKSRRNFQYWQTTDFRNFFY